MLHYAAAAKFARIDRLRAVSLKMPVTDTRPAAPSASRSSRSAIIWILKIVVSGGLLYILLRRVDLGRLWQTARTASVPYLLGALLLYLMMMFVASWRWWLLSRVQHVAMAFRALMASYLVATFFNNFLPSNIGGDVIRIRDTARAAGSKTLATTIVLVDRAIGLLGLVFVAALGATVAARMSDTIGPIGPGILWAVLAGSIVVGAPAVMMPSGVGSLLRPLRRLHQEWVEERIARLTTALARFREAPRALGACFGGAVAVQGILVLFYAAIATALHLHISMAHLAIVVPVSFIVQMLPVSVNGFGVREATFGFYFSRLGLPLEGALALSFIGAVLMMIFSLSGAVTYLVRKK